MKLTFLFILAHVIAGSFLHIISGVDAMERIVTFQGESFKLQRLRQFPERVSKVNIIDGRIFYTMDSREWLLLNNVDTPDSAVKNFIYSNCYIPCSISGTPTGTTVSVASLNLTINFDAKSNNVYCCQGKNFIVFECADNEDFDVETSFYIFNFGRVPNLSVPGLHADVIPLLKSDFPKTIINMWLHIDKFTDDIVFRANYKNNGGSSIWSIKRLNGK